MASTLIIVRSQYSCVHDMQGIRAFHESVWAELRCVKGFEDAEVWVNIASPENHVILYRYKDVEAAEEGLKVVTSEKILLRSQELQSIAANVMRIKTVKEHGALKRRFADCKYLSLSVRISEPGFAKSLEEDLERVFEECSYIPGFTGYIIGANDTLEEEVVGIASWDTEEAYLSSIPKSMVSDVVGYRREW